MGCSNWDITLRIVGRESKTYKLKRTEYPQGCSNIVAVKAEFCSEKEEIKIPLSLGDKIELTYIFRISNKFWGSYISRQLSAFEESMSVFFSKKFSDKDFECILEDKHGFNNYLKDGEISIKQNDDGYEISLDTKTFSAYQLDNYCYRIHWDADKIFSTSGLNTQMLSQDSGSILTLKKRT